MTDAAPPHELSFDVVLGGRPERMAGTVVVPPSCSGVLQVLVHGGTYTRWYWDPDMERERHSYVAAAAARGLATLAVDLVGSGRSSHPDGDTLGLAAQAEALEQVLVAVRAHGVGGQRFDSIVLVGHSFGTAAVITLLEGGGSADAAVLTGWSRKRDAAWGGLLPLNLPAADDPRFAGRNCTGYATLTAGARPFFYHLPTSSAAMLWADEQRRDVIAVADAAALSRDWEQPSAGIRVPLLVALGAHDFTNTWPDARSFDDAQRAYYPSAPVETVLLADTGHNLHLHGRGAQVIARTLDWVDRVTV